MKHFFQTIRHVGLTKIMSFIAVAGLAACSGPWPGGFVNKWKSKEYFSEKEYGVKASPGFRQSMAGCGAEAEDTKLENRIKSEVNGIILRKCVHIRRSEMRPGTEPPFMAV